MTEITHVTDTAFLVAGFRALETERTQPLFRDPLARKLAGKYGNKTPATKGAIRLAWSVAIRTVIVDDLIKLAVAEGVDTILNLGAGLDTRPYRMELPRSLRWIEVDFPAVIDLKNERLVDDRPSCRVDRFTFDLSDRASRRELFAEVGKDAGKILVLTEFVIPYLSEADVGELADDLHRLGRVGFWIVDCYPRQWGRVSKRSDKRAPFLFTPPDWFGFFADHHWRPKEIRYISRESKRLGRPLPRSALDTFWLKLKRRFASTSPRGQQNGAAFVLLIPR